MEQESSSSSSSFEGLSPTSTSAKEPTPGPVPGEMNTDANVPELLAMAMETDQTEEDSCSSTSKSTPSTIPADDTGAGVKKTGTEYKKATKLSKNFALNDKLLFPTMTQEDKEKIFAAHGKSKPKATEKKVEDDFEMVDKPKTPTQEEPFVTAAIIQSQRSLTENLAPTFSTSGDPRVDFFFHVLEQTDHQKTLDLLTAAWCTEDLHTLKLIASLRDIKDGKGVRRQYQYCLYWLYQNHPLTLYENLPLLLQLGYWKDALHFLMTVLFDGFVHPYFAFDDGVGAKTKIVKQTVRVGFRGKRVVKIKESTPHQTDDEKRAYNARILEYYKIQTNVKAVPAKQMQSLRLKYARSRFATDPKYRAFHLRVATLFAEQLHLDLGELNKLAEKGDKDKKRPAQPKLSMAGKWTRTLEGHFDRYTLIASSIAMELAKLQKKNEILNKTDNIPVAVYLARKFYNKSACIPLRTHLEIPERAMSQNEWSQVNYSRVPAKCMKLNKEHFIKHDKERFEAYLTRPETKVAGATLKPIEIIREAMKMDLINDGIEEMQKTILEKQWISLSDDIKAKGGGLLSGAISVCDVSGSMEGDPMSAAIGLTLLTMGLTAPPWDELCITFHETPTMHHVPEDLTLLEKVASLKRMPWGGSTNLQGVFQQILDIGLKNKLDDSRMPKILFIFTDMEFDMACPGTTLTNFEYAKGEFVKNGYTLPTIVFWNLRDAPGKNSTPVRVDERGVILLSGWSGQLLSFIMSQKDLANLTPWSFVESLLEKEKYNGLKIYD